MPLSSLRETAACDAAFVSNKDGGNRCCFRLLQETQNEMPNSSSKETAAKDAAFVSRRRQHKLLLSFLRETAA